MQRYIAKELTHFVGRGLSSDKDRYELLLKIIKTGWITHYPHNPNISGNLYVNPNLTISKNEMYSPEMICFCDIPTEHLEIHMSKYSHFGLSFKKSFLVDHGATPVFYIPYNAKVDVSLITEDGKYIRSKLTKAEYYDSMISLYNEVMEIMMRNSLYNHDDRLKLMNFRNFVDFHFLSYIKFFDSEKEDNDNENFYMEREWRIIGNLNFCLDDIERIMLPKIYAESFRNEISGYKGELIFSK